MVLAYRPYTDFRMSYTFWWVIMHSPKIRLQLKHYRVRSKKVLYCQTLRCRKFLNAHPYGLSSKNPLRLDFDKNLLF